VERRGSQELSDELDKQGDRLGLKIEQYAPRDTAGIESNVKVKRTERGFFSRIEVKIEGTGSRGRPISKYLDHAENTNVGKQRGQGTIAKGGKAGPEFIRRATNDFRLSIVTALKRALRRGMRR